MSYKATHTCQTVKISDVCYVFDGPHATPSKTEDGPVYLGIDSLTSDGHINPAGFNHLSVDDYAIWTKRVTPQENDIVFTYEATLGRYAIIPKGFYGCLGRRIALVRAKDDRVNPQWLLYYFLSPKWQSFIESRIVIGSTVNRIPIKMFPNYEIDLPDRNTQDRIVAVLGRLDELIEVNNKVRENLQQQANALYFSFFVNFELCSSEGMKTTEMGDIPQNWRIATLSEVTTNIRARVNNRKCSVLSAVNSGSLVLSEDYFSKQVYSKDIGKYIVVEPYDFAYNPARVNIGSIGMNDLNICGCVSPVYVVFRTEPEYQYFFDFFIKSSRFKEETKVRASGSVRQSMNYSDFGLIQIAYPPRDVISRFNAAYLPLLRHIQHIAAENECLINLRDTLLPTLMAGEIDISAVQP